MALGLLNAGVAFSFGRRWFDTRMGLLFAGLMATYWGFIYFEGDLLEPSLFSALILWLLWDLSLWINGVTFRRSLRTGLLLGLCALVRPNVLLFAPMAVLWVVWVWRGRGENPRAGLLGLVVATALTMAPVTLRNYVVAGDFVPISSNAGIALLCGNNDDANGLITPEVPNLGTLDTSFDYPRLVRAAEEQVGRPLKHSEASAHFGGLAWQYIKEHPLETLRVTWRKALLFWGPVEVGNNREDELERAHSAVLSRIPGNFAAATALFLLGVGSLLLRRKQLERERLQVAALVVLFVVAYFLSNLPFFAAGRFRMPIVPSLFFFGAVGLDHILRLAKAREFGSLAPLLLGLGAAYGVTSRNFAGHEPSALKWHYDRGVRLAADGKADEAMREYGATLRIQPDYAPALSNLGALHEFEGRPDEAVRYFEAALRSDPSDALASRSLAKILVARGALELAASHYRAALESRESPALFVEYGDVLLQLKRDRAAMAAYHDALRLDPAYAPAHNNLAVLLFVKGDYGGAWREVELTRKYGGTPPPEFMKALEEKLSER
jgi:tetratricopeptide (TPR) repeat protein